MFLHDTTTGDDVQRVRSAIAHLAPAERDLLVLRFADDRTVAELAATTGTTPDEVRRRLHHAAWVVQDLAGVTPLQWGEPEPRLLEDRDPLLVEEEAAAGITPLLAARLAAAVAGEPPAADQHWRLHALFRGLRTNMDGVLTVLLVAAAALPAAASLAS